MAALKASSNDRFPIWKDQLMLRRPLGHTKGPHKVAQFPTPLGTDWADITIRVTSETRVQIHVGAVIETRTFEELGFGDRRSSTKKPRSAWGTLLQLAEKGGEYEIQKFRDLLVGPSSKAVSSLGRDTEQWKQKAAREHAVGKKRRTEEVRMKEIRQHLRALFGLEGDPLPFLRDGDWFGYRAKFQICCAESYHQ